MQARYLTIFAPDYEVHNGWQLIQYVPIFPMQAHICTDLCDILRSRFGQGRFAGFLACNLVRNDSIKALGPWALWSLSACLVTSTKIWPLTDCDKFRSQSSYLLTILVFPCHIVWYHLMLEKIRRKQFFEPTVNSY